MFSFFGKGLKFFWYTRLKQYKDKEPEIYYSFLALNEIYTYNMILKMYLIFWGNKTKGCMYIKDAGEQQPYKKGLKS